ncbi:bifunctional diguanylate cyclase/phosphodiesterase [Rheinheimera baltica]|uniref:sensor domain-containing protein n=1 Tax=Rheinheimera baltica TaxID=67576 RepID=UPI00273D7C79|nr:bifunctional diguanylate cyclase/phosphodiesterase [Rheinheimera baltica]MDP5142104.1 bifunctional diguanylate cyclase/phosphodiesterase [Rheinheimera baltica]
MNYKIRQAIADLIELAASTSSNKWLALVVDESLEPVIHTAADKEEIKSYLQAAEQLIDRQSRELIKIELQETVAVLNGETSRSTFMTARTLKAVNLFNARGDHQGLLVALSVTPKQSDNMIEDALPRIAQLAEQFISAGTSEDLSQQALEHSFNINRAILNTLYDAVVMTDLKGCIQSVNPAFEKMFGYPENELIGESITKLMPPEVAHHHPDYMLAYAEGKTAGRIMGNVRAVQGLRADGTRFTLQIAITEARVGDERLLVAALQDITESEEARLNLKRFRKTLDSTLDCVFMFDAQYLQFFYVNQGAVDQLGYTTSELLGLHPYDVKPHYSESEFRKMIAPLINGEVPRLNFQTVHRHKNGHDLPVDILLQYVKLEDEPARFIAIVRDITKQQQYKEEIEHLAYFDPLTKLPNRSLIVERLESCLRACAQNGHFGAVMLTDLDDFKSINDTLGHRDGDQLLIEISSRFANVLGDRHSISRLGGDEFLVVINTRHQDYSAALDEVSHIAKQLLTAAVQPTDTLGHAPPISTSIGLVLFNDDSTCASELMRMADIAMYDAKKKGKNHFSLFDDIMQKELVEEHELTADLNRALLAENEIVPWFQPKVDRNGRFIGFEALARWHHPERGLLNPVSFIELAEKKNLMVPLSDQILMKTCRVMSNWRERFAINDLTVSVNISQSQLAMSNFPDKVAKVLAETGLPASALILEVTESVIAENIDASIQQMGRIRAMGVRFSLDDFGTGYSSLSYIRQLPIDELKIDRSFVNTLLSDAETRSIVKIILLLADVLKLDVIAEGIEQEEQWQALQEMGCSGFQGYLFSRPQPPEIIFQKLQSSYE